MVCFNAHELMIKSTGYIGNQMKQVEQVQTSYLGRWNQRV
jgi:hypothetical protein